MSYFFPHQTRKATKKRTVKLFENYSEVASSILERLAKQLIEDIPLHKELIATPIHHPEICWTYEQWRDVYIKNGWTEVEAYWKKQNSLLDEYEEWNDFTKQTDLGTFTNSYPIDCSIYIDFRWWEMSQKSWEERLNLIKDATFDLKILTKFDTIYFHEAFLILLGISPDNMNRKLFFRWLLEGMPSRFKDYPEMNDKGFKSNYTDFTEWQDIKRKFKSTTSKGELLREIDTKDFIKWALNSGVIEQNTSHYRDGRKAPYDDSFSLILHKELLDNDLIKECRHEDEWTWNIQPTNGANSFNYLGKLLAKNRVPIMYWLPFRKHSVSWKNLQHYIVGVKNPKNQTSAPSNAIVIEQIVQRLMEEHDNRPLTEYKYLDDEDDE
jgi:hypothetical protein|tara:strand:+ start:1105 stop:2247 length:1143 start_codon:yes stop_codon:yes gene_type:complete